MFKSLRTKRDFLIFGLCFGLFCHSVAGGGKRHGKVESSSKRTLACLELPNFPDIFPLAYSDFIFIPENTGNYWFFFIVHHFDKNFLTGRNATQTCTYISVPSEPGSWGGGDMGPDLADRLTLIQSWGQIMWTTWYSPIRIFRYPYGSAYASLYLSVLCLA